MKTLAMIVALLLTGCASVPSGTPQRDNQAKQFTPEDGKGSLYIFRDEAFMGSAKTLTILINGMIIGATAAKTYFWLSLPPGKYTIQSLGEDVSTLKVDIEAKRNKFVWQEVRVGWMGPRSKLHLVDDERGKAGVNSSILIASQATVKELQQTDPQEMSANSKYDHSAAKKLRELEALKKEGVIDELEYQKKRQDLINRL